MRKQPTMVDTSRHPNCRQTAADVPHGKKPEAPPANWATGVRGIHWLLAAGGEAGGCAAVTWLSVRGRRPWSSSVDQQYSALGHHPPRSGEVVRMLAGTRGGR